jgi:hypothetical protein
MLVDAFRLLNGRDQGSYSARGYRCRGRGKIRGLARVLLLLSLVYVRVVEKQHMWIKTLSGRSSKLRMFQGEGVISKCLNGRLTDATNKLRASGVDVIRE